MFNLYLPKRDLHLFVQNTQFMSHSGFDCEAIGLHCNPLQVFY